MVISETPQVDIAAYHVSSEIVENKSSGGGGNPMYSLGVSDFGRSLIHSRGRVVRLLLIFCAFLCWQPHPAAAQEASIVGTVTDPSGATVPGVQITITNLDTGLTRTIPTNEAGQYVLADLHIGHYTVTSPASKSRRSP